MVAGLDQAVGVEREHGAVGQLDLDLLEGLAAHPERHPLGDLQQQRGLVRLDEYRGQVPRVGERTAPGDRVVDGVDAGGEVDLGQVGVGAALGALAVPLVGGVAQAPGDLVQRAQHFGGLHVGEGQGAHGGAQFAHGDGGAQAAPHHVADDDGRAVAGQLDHVEPVAANLRGRVARQIAAGDVQARRLRVARRQQAALEDEGALVFPAVKAGVVDADGGARRQLGGQRPVPLAERLAALGAGELRQAQHPVPGDHGHGERRLHDGAELRGHAAVPVVAARSGSPVASTIALTSRWPQSGDSSSSMRPDSRLSTPPGTSDTPATSPRSSARSGQRREMTATTVLPAASAGATSRTRPSRSGWSGASTATTPVGSGVEKLR